MYYFIYKLGVYGHGVWGIYTNKDKAIRHCRKAAYTDCDDYHTWAVYSAPMETLADHIDPGGEGWCHNKLFECTKKNARTPGKESD